MSLLPSKKSYLGIDLGTSAIKIVELQNKNGRAVLLTYGYVEQPTDIVRSSSSEMEERIVEIVKSICQKSRTTSKKVIAALPSFSVFTSIISLPAMKKKDLHQAIKWEAKKFIPLPIEDMVLDWKIVPPEGSQHTAQTPKADHKSEKKDESKKEGSDKEEDSSSNPLSKLFKKDHSDKETKLKKEDQNLKILLTAAPKTLVERYLRIFKSAGLEIVSLETESFALERSLQGGDPAPVMIIDIGAVSSDIVVINNGIPILNRSIDVGGVTITKAIMSSLNVDITRAEQFKRDIGFSDLGEDNLPNVIKTSISPIINEIKYCLDIYLSQAGTNNIEKIILTGGSSWLPDLAKHLSKILDVKVIIGDPWDRVVYPLELKPVLKELGPRFSVAVGLAMREM